MPSRAETVASREWAERALRAAALALVVLAIWRLVFGTPTGSRSTSGADLERDLPSLLATRFDQLHVSFVRPPSPFARDALAAIGRAGTHVTWNGSTIAPLAMTAERLGDPSAAVRIAVTSNGDVELRDSRELLDTVRAATGATLEVGAPLGDLTARVGTTAASASVSAPRELRPVLVLGRAGWEAKFAVAALEEAGWIVETRLALAPAANVTQGKLGALDTSRYAAVVAIDTSVGASGPAIAPFVRAGGGLVLLADAASAAPLRALAPARVGARRAALTRDVLSADPFAALPLFPLESPRVDAVRLSSRAAKDAPLASAARREGAGRVLQVGYDESWRWRMQGGDDAVAAHRAWWSRLVASVVPTHAPADGPRESGNGAPLAQLIEALGEPTLKRIAASTPSDRLPPWLLPAVLALLLAEWSSRRLRGTR